MSLQFSGSGMSKKLKEFILSSIANILSTIEKLKDQIKAIAGVGGYLPQFDFGDPSVTPSLSQSWQIVNDNSDTTSFGGAIVILGNVTVNFPPSVYRKVGNYLGLVIESSYDSVSDKTTVAFGDDFTYSNETIVTNEQPWWAISTDGNFQSAVSNHAVSVIKSITSPDEIFDGTRIVNAYDSIVWVLANTPNTIPPIFEWVPGWNISGGVLSSNSATFFTTTTPSVAAGASRSPIITGITDDSSFSVSGIGTDTLVFQNTGRYILKLTPRISGVNQGASSTFTVSIMRNGQTITFKSGNANSSISIMASVEATINIVAGDAVKIVVALNVYAGVLNTSQFSIVKIS